MTPPAMMMERPRLFPLDGEQSVLRRSLDDVVLELLADADHGTCLVCDGRTHSIVGGAQCEDCGSELLMGAEAA